MVCMCFFSLVEAEQVYFHRLWKPAASANNLFVCLCWTSAPLDVVLLNEPMIKVGHPGRMKETGITGQKGRTPGVVSVRNNHWMQHKASWGPTAQASGPQERVRVWNTLAEERVRVWNTLAEERVRVWNTLAEERVRVWNTLAEERVRVWNTLAEERVRVWNTLAEERVRVWNALAEERVRVWNALAEERVRVWNALAEERVRVWNTLAEWPTVRNPTQQEKGQRTDPWRTPADGDVEEGGSTQMKDDYREKEVFIWKQKEHIYIV